MFSYAQKKLHVFQVVTTAFWPVSRNHWEVPAFTFFIPLPQVFIDGKVPPEPSLPQAAIPALSASPPMSENSCAGTHRPVSRSKRTQSDPQELGQNFPSTGMKSSTGWTQSQILCPAQTIALSRLRSYWGFWILIFRQGKYLFKFKYLKCKSHLNEK